MVGGVAKDQMVTNPKNTLYGTKRLIGRKYHSKVGRGPQELLRLRHRRGPGRGRGGDARRQDVQPAARVQRHPRAGEDHRRAVPRRAHQRGRHLRPGLLQRQPAQRGEGGRAAGGLRREAHRQRAHRRRAGLRLQPRPGSEDPRLRSGRRHLRRVRAAAHRQRLRGAGHRRRHLPGRRGLRQPRHRLRAREVPRGAQARSEPDAPSPCSASRTPPRRRRSISPCASTSSSICPTSRSARASRWTCASRSPATCSTRSPAIWWTAPSRSATGCSRRRASSARRSTRSSSWAARAACRWCSRRSRSTSASPLARACTRTSAWPWARRCWPTRWAASTR